jgi:hypothetical protein
MQRVSDNQVDAWIAGSCGCSGCPVRLLSKQVLKCRPPGACWGLFKLLLPQVRLLVLLLPPLLFVLLVLLLVLLFALLLLLLLLLLLGGSLQNLSQSLLQGLHQGSRKRDK